MICVGVGFGSMGGGGLISIGVIFVGNGVVNGCSGVGLVVQRLGQLVQRRGFDRGLLCFFFFFFSCC